MAEISRERRIEIAVDAQELLRSAAFNSVVTHLIAEQVTKLTENAVGSLTAQEAHATLRALNSMKSTLSALAADRAVLEKQG